MPQGAGRNVCLHGCLRRAGIPSASLEIAPTSKRRGDIWQSYEKRVISTTNSWWLSASFHRNLKQIRFVFLAIWSVLWENKKNKVALGVVQFLSLISLDRSLLIVFVVLFLSPSPFVKKEKFLYRHEKENHRGRCEFCSYFVSYNNSCNFNPLLLLIIKGLTITLQNATMLILVPPYRSI